MDQKAGFTAGPICFKERLAGRIIFDGMAIVLKYIPYSLSNVAVVVDNENDRVRRVILKLFKGWHFLSSAR